MAGAVTRRKLLGGGAAVLAAAGVGYFAGGQNLFYDLLTEETFGEKITPEQAHLLARDKAITLIDIRRPDEWARTGSGEGANRLDMRREDFIAGLEKLTGADRGKPIALICARGVRSARLTNRLTKAGFTNIVDVPEGMLGSGAGPGWIKRGLPLVKN